jgi:hypothetical protein
MRRNAVPSNPIAVQKRYEDGTPIHHASNVLTLPTQQVQPLHPRNACVTSSDLEIGSSTPPFSGLKEAPCSRDAIPPRIPALSTIGQGLRQPTRIARFPPVARSYVNFFDGGDPRDARSNGRVCGLACAVLECWADPVRPIFVPAPLTTHSNSFPERSPCRGSSYSGAKSSRSFTRKRAVCIAFSGRSG